MSPRATATFTSRATRRGPSQSPHAISGAKSGPGVLAPRSLDMSAHSAAQAIPVCVVCVVLSCLCTLIVIPASGFRLTRRYGIILIGYYFVFLAGALAVQSLPMTSPLLSWFGSPDWH